DAKGNEVLKTLPGGDKDAYGAPSATHDNGQDATRVLPGWDGYSPDEGAWTHGARATMAAHDATSATFDLADGAMHISVAIDGAKVKLHFAAHGDPSWNKSTIAFALRDDEHFFGLGERFASVDHRGISMYSWAEEGSLGAGENAPRAADNPYP